MEKKSEMNPLYIFDFDDTLAMTNSHVRVIKKDGKINRLDSREFAAYRSEPGDRLDFSEFNRAEGDLIQNTIRTMEDAIETYGISNVYIVTARSISEPVTKFLDTMGVTAPEVIATAGSEGKATWLTRQLSSKNYSAVFVYEDCRKNIMMLKDVVEAYNEELSSNIEYKAICILPGGSQEMVEKLLRDYIKKVLYT